MVGGIAAAQWIESRGEGAGRNTRDVNVLIHRTNLEDAHQALLSSGFVSGKLPNGEIALVDGEYPDPKFGVRYYATRVTD